jgi:hypothetical protein
MPVDYKYILFNIKNDKLSIFCVLTHRYGKHRKSQSINYEKKRNKYYLG